MLNEALPPHLQKHFRKDGSSIHQPEWEDVTPAGYGPDEEARWASNQEANDSMNNLRMDVEQAHGYMDAIDPELDPAEFDIEEKLWQEAAHRYADAWEEYNAMGFTGHQYQAGEGDPYKYLTEGVNMKITKRQLRRIIRESLTEGTLYVTRGPYGITVEDENEEDGSMEDVLINNMDLSLGKLKK